MIDLQLIREAPHRIAESLRARGTTFPLDELLALGAERRRLLQEAEELRALRNRVSEEIARTKRAGQPAEREISHMREVGEQIKALDPEIRSREERIEALLLELPNVPHESVPRGASAEENVVVRSWGNLRRFDFAPRPHWEIGEALAILDFARGAKLAGSRFTVLWGVGAQLERALITFMLDLHTKEHGYREIWTPALVNSASLRGTGQLPKFAADLFQTRTISG